MLSPQQATAATSASRSSEWQTIGTGFERHRLGRAQYRPLKMIAFRLLWYHRSDGRKRMCQFTLESVSSANDFQAALADSRAASNLFSVPKQQRPPTTSDKLWYSRRTANANSRLSGIIVLTMRCRCSIPSEPHVTIPRICPASFVLPAHCVN